MNEIRRLEGRTYVALDALLSDEAWTAYDEASKRLLIATWGLAGVNTARDHHKAALAASVERVAEEASRVS